MKSLYILTVIILFGLFTPDASCMARKPSTKERTAQGVYGTAEAISKGRIDTAKLFADETKSLITPPKKPLKVNEVKNTVILPSHLVGRKVVVVDSGEYKSLLSDKAARKALESSNREHERFAAKVNKTLIEQSSEQDRVKLNLENAKETIVKRDKKIADLKFYRNLVGGVVGIITLAIVLWVVSIVVRIALAAAKVAS